MMIHEDYDGQFPSNRPIVVKCDGGDEELLDYWMLDDENAILRVSYDGYENCVSITNSELDFYPDILEEFIDTDRYNKYF